MTKKALNSGSFRRQSFFVIINRKNIRQQPRVPGINCVRPDTGYTAFAALLPELVNNVYYKTKNAR